MSENNPIPQNEEERLEVLGNYNLEEVVEHQEFAALTQLAAQLCKMPMAVINFIDSDSMWSIASYGLELQDEPRGESVCQYTITDNKPVVIDDLKEHPKFKDKNYVNNAPNIRFYAGVPLRASKKHIIGTLCVYDNKANSIQSWQMESLKILADEVIARLDLRLGQKKLQELNQQKDDILHIVSHDMRTPLSGILGIANLVKTDGYKDEKELQLYMGMIEQSAEHLLQHVNELMDVSYIESDSLELNPSDIDVEKVVKETVNLHQPAAKVKQVDLTTKFNITKKTGPFDELRLEQIIGNLITNAIKFTNAGGQVSVCVAYSVDDSCTGQSDEMKIVVEDDGIGIPEKFVNILFTKYGKHGRTGTSGEKSIGLGLPILKQLVDAHNGRIDVETEEDAGTTFTIILPDIGSESG